MFRLTWREVEKTEAFQAVKNTSERARVVEETAVVVLLTRHWKELGTMIKRWGKQSAGEAEGALGRKQCRMCEEVM